MGGLPLTVPQWKEVQLHGGELQRLLDLLNSLSASDAAWITIVDTSHLREQWQALEILRQQGLDLPLFGVQFAVKGSIDVRGVQTTAGCPDYAYIPSENATVISSLQRAGAIVIGKTNLDQFATGLNGTRSPYGAVPNTFDPVYISGGSSSGSASVVARGIVPFSLATDTAGSGRVPAGLNNIIGLKATPGAVSTHGVVPACRTLDCVTIFALTIEDAAVVHDVAAEYDPLDPYSQAKPTIVSRPISFVKPRIAICDAPEWFGDANQAASYGMALQQIRQLGWVLSEISFACLFELASLLYAGPWVAERYHTVRDVINDSDFHRDETDRQILNGARKFDATDAFDYEYKRQYITRQIKQEFRCFDAIIVPTVPIPVFPTIKQLSDDPVTPNNILGTYTNFVNFLGWTAITLPAGFRTDRLPFGITLISWAWNESELLQLARRFSSIQPRRLGATTVTLLKSPHPQVSSPDTPGHPDEVELVVVGAHLSGLPLNYQLLDIGGRLLLETRTSPNYKLYALPEIVGRPRKPGLVRVSSGESGNAIAVEKWSIPSAAFGRFVASIPSPLVIGKIELADGSFVSGFLCETYGAVKGVEVSQFGGWRRYVASTSGVPNCHLPSGLFRKILVANRGEIAVRLMRTIKRLGIDTIAISSSEDATAPHVLEAGEAVHLPGKTITGTYLNGDYIISIAKDKGADAIIPGYRMLSENAQFATACEKADICWIGPTPEQIEALGLKHVARDLAIKAGVPVVPGSSLISSEEDAVAESNRIGYPVMLKSTAGGGGIGLVQCHTPDQTRQALATAQRLSMSYFKDDGVFIEHLVQCARYIEIAVAS